jgi:ribosomal protein S6
LKVEKGIRVKRYEGLFILNPPAKEDGLKEVMDKLQREIESVGGRVENTQKMDKRPFARVTDKRHPSGYYVNYLFEAPEDAPAAIRARLRRDESVLRMMFTVAPPPKAPAPAPVA